jgi:hypothetical protein
MFLMSLSTLRRAFVSLSGMPVPSSRQRENCDALSRQNLAYLAIIPID